MKSKRSGRLLAYLGPVFALVMSAGAAHAATACPFVGNDNSTNQTDSGTDFCQYLITISSSGVASISTSTYTTPYDFGINGTSLEDDEMIGIVNNWAGHTITSVSLSGTDAFDFSADPGPSNDNPCNVAFSNASEPVATGCGTQVTTNFDNYGGPGVTSIVETSDTSHGTVSFSGVTTSSGVVWFGLEGPISGTPTFTSTTSGTPEPGTLGLVGLGLLGAGFIGNRRRRAR